MVWLISCTCKHQLHPCLYSRHRVCTACRAWASTGYRAGAASHAASRSSASCRTAEVFGRWRAARTGAGAGTTSGPRAGAAGMRNSGTAGAAGAAAGTVADAATAAVAAFLPHLPRLPARGLINGKAIADLCAPEHMATRRSTHVDCSSLALTECSAVCTCQERSPPSWRRLSPLGAWQGPPRQQPAQACLIACCLLMFSALLVSCFDSARSEARACVCTHSLACFGFRPRLFLAGGAASPACTAVGHANVQLRL